MRVGLGQFNAVVGDLAGNGGIVSYTLRVTVGDAISGTSITNMAALSSNETGPQESDLLGHPVQESGEDTKENIYLPLIVKGATE